MSLSDKLEEIKKRADAATEGPWNTDKVLGGHAVVKRKVKPGKGKGIDDWPTTIAGMMPGSALGVTPDMKFIAHARTDVPKLLAVIEKLIEQRNELAALVEDETRETSKYLIDTDADDATLCKILGGEE